MRKAKTDAFGAAADRGSAALSPARDPRRPGSRRHRGRDASARPEPPSTVTSPPRDFGPGAPTTYFTDPGRDHGRSDVRTAYVAAEHADPAPLDRRALGGGPGLERRGPLPRLERHPEQPADALARGGRPRLRVPEPANNSNGNTFDSQGRQLSCEHLTRRVVRYEHDGAVDGAGRRYNGKRLNSPNDVVPHPDGSVWFTDPPYGAQLYEGMADAPAARATRGPAQPALGQPAGISRGGASCRMRVSRRSERPDRPGVTDDQVPDPNGLCFSPDYKKLYVCRTGKGPGDTGPGGKGDIYAFDVGDGQLRSRTRGCSRIASSTA